MVAFEFFAIIYILHLYMWWTSWEFQAVEIVAMLEEKAQTPQLDTSQFELIYK